MQDARCMYQCPTLSVLQRTQTVLWHASWVPDAPPLLPPRRSSHYALLLKLRTQALVSATITVQKNLRACLASRAFQEQRRLIISTQAEVRRLQAQQELLRRRQERAAVRVQSQWRRFAAVRTYRRQQAAVLTLQSGARGMAARTEVRGLRRERAAVAVQSMWRGFAVRKVVRQQLAQQRAAVVMQSAWRGRHARAVFGEQLRRSAAARTIQRSWQKHHFMKNFRSRLQLLKSVLTIQRVWRSVNHSTRVQRRFRDVVYSALAMQRAALIMQTLYRSLAARRWYEMRQKQQRQERLRKFIQVGGRRLLRCLGVDAAACAAACCTAASWLPATEGPRHDLQLHDSWPGVCVPVAECSHSQRLTTACVLSASAPAAGVRVRRTPPGGPGPAPPHQPAQDHQHRRQERQAHPRPQHC
jgi:hypothetical protein